MVILWNTRHQKEREEPEQDQAGTHITKTRPGPRLESEYALVVIVHSSPAETTYARDAMKNKNKTMTEHIHIESQKNFAERFMKTVSSISRIFPLSILKIFLPIISH